MNNKQRSILKPFRKLFSWKIGLIFALLLLVAFASGFVFGKQILLVSNLPRQAEAIVVLGGEHGARLFRAAELYHAGLAPFVVVSGRDEVEVMAHRLKMCGIPEKDILREPKASNTKENAEYVADILGPAKVETLLLVTNWYHTRRARACFKKYMPDTKILVISADNDNQEFLPAPQDVGYLYLEYLKRLVYLIRYGI